MLGSESMDVMAAILDGSICASEDIGKPSESGPGALFTDVNTG